MSMDRFRTLAEVEAATGQRTHPEERLTIAAMDAITSAPMIACGHLEGFLAADHPADPEDCIAARQAHVDKLWGELQAGTR